MRERERVHHFCIPDIFVTTYLNSETPNEISLFIWKPEKGKAEGVVRHRRGSYIQGTLCFSKGTNVRTDVFFGLGDEG